MRLLSHDIIGDLMFKQTAHQITALVMAEIEKVTLSELAAAIKAWLIPPFLHTRQWEWGKDEEAFPCWAVLAHPPSGTGIAYCEYGFGPRCPWGLVFLDSTQNHFGGDYCWYPSLEEAFCESYAASDLPIWDVVKIHQDIVSEVVLHSLALDAAFQYVEEWNTCLHPNWKQKVIWPHYTVRRRP